MANIAEEFLEEAALAPQRLGFLAGWVDLGDLLHPTALNRDDIARRIKAYPHGRLLRGCWRVERILARVARKIIIILRAKLADPCGATQRLFHRIAIIHARLNRIRQRWIRNIALMAHNPRAPRRSQSEGDKREGGDNFAVHARRPFHDAT